MTKRAEKKAFVTLAQDQLKAAGVPNVGPSDGLLGPKTSLAVATSLARNNTLPVRWNRWPAYRQLVAYLQALLNKQGIEAGPVDGLVGPQTRYAVEIFQHRIATGPDPAPWRDDDLGGDEPSVTDWPRYRQLVNFYGEPGTNHGMLKVPYTMKIAWDKRKRLTKFTAHERIIRPAERVLDRALDHYGLDGLTRIGADLFGGCFNNRRMRGGRSLSTHAFACAIDFDPERNQLRWGKDRARLAEPDAQMFWRLWEEEGFTSLGRRKNYDWMHIQACDL